MKCVEDHLTVKVGEDLLARCHYSSPDEANGTTLSWTKLDTMTIIYNYSISQTEQDPSSQDRAEVFGSEGNIFLRLRNVTLLDSGIYGLRVSSRTQSNETHIMLGVRGKSNKSLLVFLLYVDINI